MNASEDPMSTPIIDARSGQHLQRGDRLPYSEPPLYLESANIGWFDAVLVFREPKTGDSMTVNGIVRYLHPGFWLQKVVFVPS